jgi:hypothetical protein
MEKRMKNYRFFGDEAELLGKRLDAARKSLAGSNTEWARKYWKSTVDQLVFQWRQLPILHDGDAQVTIIPRWTVRYDYFEDCEEMGNYGITDRIFDEIFRTNLDESWENHRAQRLAKAQ